jgi:hypothetical protein
MKHEREHVVTEARVGLALVICFLMVLGYMVLHYLGGTWQAPRLEVRPGLASERASAPQVPPRKGDEQPQVLTIESSDGPEQALRTVPESNRR